MNKLTRYTLATTAVVLVAAAWTQYESILLLIRSSPDEVSAEPVPSQQAQQVQLKHGEAMARAYCATCHAWPAPEVLDRRAWLTTLSRMRVMLGIIPPESGLQVNPDGFERVVATGIFPPQPVINPEDWNAVVKYYIHYANKSTPFAPTSHPTQELFATEMVVTPFDAQCLQLGLNDQGLWVSHEGTDALHLRDPDGKWSMLHPGGTASQWRPFEGGHIGTMIGSFYPSFKPSGALIHWKDGKSTPLLKPVHRPTDVLPVDLNADGRLDLVVCEYGNMLGSTFWLENTVDGFKKHTLLSLPGCLNVATGHFNADKIPDLVFLTGQAREAVFLCLSTGPGTFETKMLLERHPAWGHSHIEVLDFNTDGHPDLLITNGDNGEYRIPPHKDYHGIRLHLNDGQNNFNEALFFPQPGAYKALARDFDQDGDLDIASIAYFADYRRNPQSGFVLLRQEAPMQFSPHGLSSAEGRWLTMDAGDWDQDGDIDIVLGAHNQGPHQEGFPASITARWQNRPLPLMLLKNRTKK